MNEELKTIIKALPKDERYGAQSFWERIHDTCLAQMTHEMLRSMILSAEEMAPGTPVPTKEQMTRAAADLADKSLLQWMERWGE